MNLYRLLRQRAEAGRPVRVGLIGAGKFGSMFLSQVPSTPGLEVAAIADLAPDRAREACRRVGWNDERIAATRFTDDALGAIGAPDVEVVVEATGHAPAGIAHARRAIAEGKHIVMVNVEADVLAGTAAGARGGARGRRLFAGLWRSAGADLRAGRLGAGLRVSRARRRQGHEIPAGIPRLHAGDGLGLLRPDRGAGAHRRHEPADVQLLPRRHEVGDRDGGGRQCDRLAPPAGRAAVPARRHARTGRGAALGQRSAGQVEVVSSLHRDGSAGGQRPALGRLRGVRGAERLRRALLRANTAWSPTPPAGSPRCTGRST